MMKNLENITRLAIEKLDDENSGLLNLSFNDRVKLLQPYAQQLRKYLNIGVPLKRIITRLQSQLPYQVTIDLLRVVIDESKSSNHT